MSNITVVNKSPGDQHTAAELNEQVNFINTPAIALGAFIPSAVTMETQGFYDGYTVSANVTITFSGTPKHGIWQKTRMTGFNGSYTLTVPNGTVILNNSFTDGGAIAAGTYDIWFAYLNNEYLVNLVEVSIVSQDLTPTTLTSATIENATDSVLDLVFADAVTITTAGWTINTDGAGLSISSVLSGDGTTTPKFQLSRSILSTETLTLDYSSATGATVKTSNSVELADIVADSVTNNVLSGYTFTNTQHLVIDEANEGVAVDQDSLYPSDGAGNDLAMSWEFWYKTPNTVNTGRSLMKVEENSNTAIMVGITSGNALYFQLYDSSLNKLEENSNIDPDKVVTINYLNHIVITYSGSETNVGMKIYKNGKQLTTNSANTGTYTGLDGAGSNIVLHLPYAPAAFGEGLYENFRVFDKELSSGEVTTLYNSGTPLSLSTAGLVADCILELQFEGDATAEIGTNGSLVGTPVFAANTSSKINLFDDFSVALPTRTTTNPSNPDIVINTSGDLTFSTTSNSVIPPSVDYVFHDFYLAYEEDFCVAMDVGPITVPGSKQQGIKVQAEAGLTNIFFRFRYQTGAWNTSLGVTDDTSIIQGVNDNLVAVDISDKTVRIRRTGTTIAAEYWNVSAWTLIDSVTIGSLDPDCIITTTCGDTTADSAADNSYDNWYLVKGTYSGQYPI